MNCKCICLLCFSMVSATAAIKFLQYTKGTCLISSPPPSKEKVKAPFSATMLSPMMSFAIALCFFSLDTVMFSSFSHLYTPLVSLIQVLIIARYLSFYLQLYLRTIRSLLQGRARSAFMARAWFVGMVMGRPTWPSNSSRSSAESALISAWSWAEDSPPLVIERTWRICDVRLWRVFLLAWELVTRQLVTGTNVRGYQI